jgi:hypothetical protein
VARFDRGWLLAAGSRPLPQGINWLFEERCWLCDHGRIC